jgi:hypothetical protein
LLAALNHPGIATIHELFEADGIPVLVMELVQGQTLASTLRRGALPVRQALEIALQIAAALEAAHAKGILHRDLKPSNIFLSENGRVKLVDFGLGKAVESGIDARSSGEALSEPANASTATGVVLGTAPYMSPEQARGEELDKRTDIWAFGCVLYELLAGERAFPGLTSADAVAAVLQRDPEWQALPAAMPRTVGRLLQRCLRKARNERLQDIGDARLEIMEALEEPTITWSRVGRRPAAVLGAGVLLTILVTGALVFRRVLPSAQPHPLDQFQDATRSSSVSSRPVSSPHSVLEIDHEPIGCMVARQFPVIEASIKPANAVAQARVIFKGPLASAFYHVNMVESDGRFVGKLPRPKMEASPVHYYVQATTKEFGDGRSPELEAIVVEEAKDCPKGRKVAAIGPLGEVTVFSTGFGTDLVLSLKDAFGLEDLIATLQDPDPRVREGAAASLSEIGPPTSRAITMVVRSLKDPDPLVRAGAATSLGITGRRLVRQTMASLAESLQDKSPSVRRAAAAALGEIGPGVAIGVTGLRKALKDEDANVRRNTAAALGSMGSVLSSAIATLETTSEEETEEDSVRETAVQALAKIRAELNPLPEAPSH